MAKHDLVSGTTTDWLAQPSPSAKIIVRSSHASDTQNMVLSGAIAAGGKTETIALAGQFEVESSETWVSLSVARLASVANGTVMLLDQGVAGTGDAMFVDQPADDDTLVLGLAGATVTYTFKTALTAPAVAYEVLIGTDASDTASNLSCAINDTGTGGKAEGTEWGTGTDPHPHLSATVSTDTVTFTDRLACNRYLAWTATASDTDKLKVRTIASAADGTLLTSLAIGGQVASSVISFSNWDLADTNLAAVILPESETCYVGRAAYLLTKLATAASGNVILTIDVSEDGVTWSQLTTKIVAPGDGDAEAKTPGITSLGPVEYVRVRVTTNSGGGAAFHASLWSV